MELGDDMKVKTDRNDAWIAYTMLFLVALKLAGFIQLGWWWIFMPIWIWIAVAIGIVIFAVLVVVFGGKRKDV